MTYLIQSGEGDPVPRYYSQKVARNLGSSIGWSEKRDDATPFDSEAAAYLFAEHQMGHIMFRVVRHNV